MNTDDQNGVASGWKASSVQLLPAAIKHGTRSVNERRGFSRASRLCRRNRQLLTHLNLIGVSQLIAVRVEDSHVLVRVAVVLLANL